MSGYRNIKATKFSTMPTVFKIRNWFRKKIRQLCYRTGKCGFTSTVRKPNTELQKS